MDPILVAYSGNVAVIRLNRPKALNALNAALMQDLLWALQQFDNDPEVGAVVITGNDRVFCAGADIKELQLLDYAKAYAINFLQPLNRGVAAVRKPVIAAVNGFALGGGCELAMMCDIIYCGESAQFGQPEVKLGTIPGAGGTQRMARAMGKSKAMHMILTGESIGSKDAERAGLVAKIYPDDQVLTKAIEHAQTIASYSEQVTTMAKEAVNQAENLGLDSGLIFESRLYHATFGTGEAREGITAFIEKRAPVWDRAKSSSAIRRQAALAAQEPQPPAPL